MTTKGLFVLLTIFTIQFFGACYYCECPPPIKYDVRFSGFELVPLKGDLWETVAEKDTLSVSEFVLGITATTIVTSVAQRGTPEIFGFSGAFACSCIDDEYRMVTPIKDISLYFLDELSGQKRDVSDWFYVDFSPDTSFKEAIDGIEDFDYYAFQFQYKFKVMEFEEMPKTLTIMIEGTLSNGLLIYGQTPLLNFY